MLKRKKQLRRREILTAGIQIGLTGIALVGANQALAQIIMHTFSAQALR